MFKWIVNWANRLRNWFAYPILSWVQQELNLLRFKIDDIKHVREEQTQIAENTFKNLKDIRDDIEQISRKLDNISRKIENLKS